MAMFFSPYLLREAKEGKGEKNPLRGDTAEERIHIRICKDNGSLTEGGEKTPTEAGNSKGSIRKGVLQRKRKRKERRNRK